MELGDTVIENKSNKVERIEGCVVIPVLRDKTKGGEVHYGIMVSSSTAGSMAFGHRIVMKAVVCSQESETVFKFSFAEIFKVA